MVRTNFFSNLIPTNIDSQLREKYIGVGQIVAGVGSIILEAMFLVKYLTVLEQFFKEGRLLFCFSFVAGFISWCCNQKI